MGAVAVSVDLANALVAVAGARPVTGEHDLVIVGINQPIVTATGHDTLTLAGEQAAGHGVVEVLAFVVRVHVVNVVHDVGHANGQPCSVVVIVRGGSHEPRAGDDSWRRGVDLLEVVILGRGIVHTDVHLAGVVVKINARDVVWILVVVRGLALPLDLRAGGVPTDVPLVHHVVRIVGRVDVAVVDVGIVDASCGRSAARSGVVGGRAEVGSRAGINSHDAGRCVRDVLAGVANDVNFGTVDRNGHAGVAPRRVAGCGQIGEFLGRTRVALVAQSDELSGGIEVSVAEGGD